MKKCIAFLLAAVVLMAAGLTGCGGNDTGSGAAKDTSLEDVAAKGKLVMGLDDSFPPMGYRDENNEIVGFDVDVAREVAKRMGVSLELQPINWLSNVQELNTKNVDCLWNGMSINPSRQEQMALSDPYMNNNQVLVVLGDSSYQTLGDLKGKKLAIQSGSTAQDALDEATEFKASLAEVAPFENNLQAMMDLDQKGVDAVLMDEVVARSEYLNKDGKNYRIIEEKLAEEQYAIGFRKDDIALRDCVNTTLKDMAKDGTLAQISTKWFGEDVTIIGK